MQIKTDYAKGRRTKNATLKTEHAEDGEDAEVAQKKLKCCFESQSIETKSYSMAENAGDARDAGVANKNRFCQGRCTKNATLKTSASSPSSASSGFKVAFLVLPP